MPLPHRKRVRHFEDRREPHEITFSCYRRLPLLTDDDRCLLLSRAIDSAAERHGWRVAAFVFMPEHVHLIIYPETVEARVSDFLFAVKRPFSYRVKKEIECSNVPLLESLTVRQRPGVSTFRFWQEGPGYDRNLRSEQALAASINYVHANPVKRGLCTTPVQWKWSSARWYASHTNDEDPDLPKLTKLPAECFSGHGDFTT
jgi:putative transposase